ncbi:hypothetical protein D043_4287A, partial [Vibrio parahaemolyticus EKP-021]
MGIGLLEITDEPQNQQLRMLFSVFPPREPMLS